MELENVRECILSILQGRFKTNENISFNENKIIVFQDFDSGVCLFSSFDKKSKIKITYETLMDVVNYHRNGEEELNNEKLNKLYKDILEHLKESGDFELILIDQEKYEFKSL